MYIVIDDDGASSCSGPQTTVLKAWKDYQDQVNDDTNINDVTFYKVEPVKVEVDIKVIEVITPRISKSKEIF